MADPGERQIAASFYSHYSDHSHKLLPWLLFIANGETRAIICTQSIGDIASLRKLNDTCYLEGPRVGQSESRDVQYRDGPSRARASISGLHLCIFSLFDVRQVSSHCAYSVDCGKEARYKVYRVVLQTEVQRPNIPRASAASATLTAKEFPLFPRVRRSLLTARMPVPRCISDSQGLQVQHALYVAVVSPVHFIVLYLLRL